MDLSNLNRLLTIVTITLAFFMLQIGCSSKSIRSKNLAPLELITIIHSNDIEEQWTGDRLKSNGHESEMIGGPARYAQFLRQERKKAHSENRTLLVADAGDWIIGPADETLSGDSVMMQVLNQLRPDVTTIGNHEFDVGPDVLAQRLNQLEPPVLASNTNFPTNNRFRENTSDTLILEKNSIRFGFIGLISEEMKQLTTPSNVEGLKFEDPYEVAKNIIPTFKKENVDLIVVLSHMGIEADRRLAERVDDIDLILGGHSHLPMKQVEHHSNTLIIQRGGGLNTIARIDLTFNRAQKKIKSYRGRPVELLDTFYPPHSKMVQELEPYLFRRKKLLQESIGTLEHPLTRDAYHSSDLGNLITDAMRSITGVEIALQNPFGIRSNLESGEIRRKDIREILPFRNHLVSMELSGQQLRSLMEQSASLDKGLLQISGMTVQIDFSNPTGERVQKIKVQGEPLIHKKKYRIVTNSFLAEGGDGYKTFLNGQKRTEYTQKFVRDALEEYIKNNSPLRVPKDERYRLRNMNKVRNTAR